MAIEQLAEALKQLINKSSKACFLTAKVSGVDKENFTLTAKLEDGSDLEIAGINLKPSEGAGKTFIQFPKIESRVLLANLYKAEYLLLSCDEVESVLWETSGGFAMEINSTGELKFNGGSLGGLVKARELKQQLDKTHELLDALITVINGSAIAEAGGGAPSALQAALKIAIAPHNLGNFNQIENPKITH